MAEKFNFPVDDQSQDQLTCENVSSAEIPGPQEKELWRKKLHKLCYLKEEQKRLKLRKEELQRLQTEQNVPNKEEVPFPVPQAVLVFRGLIKEGEEAHETVISDLQVHYPLPGSSALVSFEDPKVAADLLQDQEHVIFLEDCRLPVLIQPVELPVPTSIKVLTWLCNQKVLVVGLPTDLDLSEDILLDKLELFFGKPSNGGGEVTTRELLPGAAVLGFVDDKVIENLIQTRCFRVPLGSKKVSLRVFPYVDGKIQEMEISHCPVPNSVLVPNIPDILDGPEFQDVLEIHFQKPSEGGGEVESLIYVDPRKQSLALFTQERA
ncbi:interferon-induced 35 kDa protein isoform X2 [Gracilinanus agilis]|uniref:interferon-induced 35 kDa protein isoform X2 n=1 Tax=Gracilinanus agilis TaxID=191870 RepID=UPI001CFDD63C|nr:interferon-induced 35 kDa protein isoform X2 [Gracilinanus agilis]